MQPSTLERKPFKRNAEEPPTEVLMQLPPRKGTRSPDKSIQKCPVFVTPLTGASSNSIMISGSVMESAAAIAEKTLLCVPVVTTAVPMLPDALKCRVPLVPGSTKLPSGLMAFHAVEAAAWETCNAGALPSITCISPFTILIPESRFQRFPTKSEIPPGVPS